MPPGHLLEMQILGHTPDLLKQQPWGGTWPGFLLRWRSRNFSHEPFGSTQTIHSIVQPPPLSCCKTSHSPEEAPCWSVPVLRPHRPWRSLIYFCSLWTCPSGQLTSGIIRRGLLSLASLPEHHVLKVRPCCSLVRALYGWEDSTVGMDPLYSLISWWTFDVFPLFGYGESCHYEHLCTRFCVNTHFPFFGYLPGGGITGSCSYSVLNILRNFQILCTVHSILHPHSQQCLRVQFPHILISTCYFLSFG